MLTNRVSMMLDDVMYDVKFTEASVAYGPYATDVSEQ